ncbi:F-box protein [Acorus gramineus]|uniref:F-box protein n=1 Tax=Acorus gramineus TaxID=55184 RepID=A0AAV9AAW2_ACOGR|nr:F-box protein [Acorus gramineus]
MSLSPPREEAKRRSPPPLKPPPSFPDLWFRRDKPPPKPRLPRPAESVDPTSSVSDELLLGILARVPDSLTSPSYSLVCRRWLSLHGRLRRRLSLLEWTFLSSGRLGLRFPSLEEADLVPACFAPPPRARSGIVLSRRSISVPLDVLDRRVLAWDAIDEGLHALARGCPNIRKLAVVSASESGLASIASGCETLQELELHLCNDLSLKAISGCRNLQILKLIGAVDGLYGGPGVSDVGLTIVAHGCKRLVKLEMSGCEGSYDGIRAMGTCCPMLEELTISDHRMDAGWIAALWFCGNLKTLRLQGCKRIDADPGPLEHLGACPTIERLVLQRCQLRDRQSLHALLMVCGAAREIVFQDCWGLDDETFGIVRICRRIKFLLLEGCSLLTTAGLESVVLSWKDLQVLSVVSCNNIRDSEVTPALASLFSVLKELKWRPDSRSLLEMSFAGTGIGKKGGRFFKKVYHDRHE